MEEILNFLEREDLRKGPTSYSCIPIKLPFELKPEDYLKFGEEDLNEGTNKALINALSNIKRAIDCRMESLLYIFGAYKISKKEDWSFPTKISFLEKGGVIAPRILRKINKARNEIEHDFKIPIKENVEDFLDVANLFLLYTQKLVNNTYDFPFEWQFEEAMQSGEFDSDWISIKLDSEKACFEIELIKRGNENKKITVNIVDRENYFRVLKQWVSCIINN